MVGFHGNFLKDFSLLAEPLHALKRKKCSVQMGGTPEACL
jgi:hypothetical protein